jgi:hypothetical protein
LLSFLGGESGLGRFLFAGVGIGLQLKKFAGIAGLADQCSVKAGTMAAIALHALAQGDRLR